MDLLPIQAVKPGASSPGLTPTTDGEQGFSDLIDTLLAGLTADGTGPALAEEWHAAEEQKNPALGDQSDLFPDSDDATAVAQVVATPFLQPPASPISEPVETSMPPRAPVEANGTMADRRASPTPQDLDLVSVAAPITETTTRPETTRPESPEALLPAITNPARVESEPASPIPTAPGVADASPHAETPELDHDPATESEPAATPRIAPESGGRQEPAETSPQEAGTERIEVPDREPVSPTRPGTHDPSPVASPDSPPVARVADTPASDDSRTATAELVDRLTEWAERVEAGQRSDAISLRLADADGEMVVRLTLREGRLELSVTRPGGENMPWLADQLGDALTERGFDMAESEIHQGPDDEESGEARRGRARSKTPERQRDGILM